MKRALIVKLGAIGDVVMAIPAVHRFHLLGYAIDWVANAQAATVLRHYSFVNVLEADEAALLKGAFSERLRALRDIWAQLGRYEVVVTLYYDWRYRLVSLPTITGKHVSLHRNGRNSHLLAGRHHTDEFARILLSIEDSGKADSGPVAHGLEPLRPSGLPTSPLPTSSRRVVLAPGGARNLHRDDSLRRWPIERYAALARLLVESGYEVVLTGGPGDLWVRDAFADQSCVDLVGQLSLPELLALFDSSAAVVTHDSGPLHLAGVTSCVLLAIFGPVDPWMRLPRRPGAAALWGGEGFACRPCYDGSGYANCTDNLCMAQITSEMAFEILGRLLAEKKSDRLPPPAVYLPPATGPLITIASIQTRQ